VKRALIIFWNVFLGAFIGFYALIIMPRVIPQFRNLERYSDPAFKAQVIMAGFEGIGLLMAVAVCAVSLSSRFWRRIPLFWRVLFGSAFAAFCIGVVFAVGIDQANGGFVFYADYATFLLVSGFFLLPPVVMGRGHPDLALRLYSKLKRNKIAKSKI